MNNLFLLLFFVSALCLIVGLFKPSTFSRFVKGEITRKRIVKIFGIATIAFIVLFGITNNFSKNNGNTQQSTTEISKKEIKMLWDIPMIMNKSHNQIVKILGNPTMIDKLSDGKYERFKFVNGEMQRFFEEDNPYRRGMKITEYDVYYKQSDCEMSICGNDLWYSYTDPDQPIKYFSICNYPIEKPNLSISELKQIGNLNNNSEIKIIPEVSANGKSITGIYICEKNYQGSEYEFGSENCLK